MTSAKNADLLFLQEKTRLLLQADALRMSCLRAVRDLQLPQGMIAAGFVRNLIWDNAQGYSQGPVQASALTDVDVAFFNAQDLSQEQEKHFEAWLAQQLPGPVWQVRNQARMHQSYGIAAYLSAADAINRFPETATCIAVALDTQDRIHFPVHAGLEDAWALRLRPNPACQTDGFTHRLASKSWRQQWPALCVVTAEEDSFGYS